MQSCVVMFSHVKLSVMFSFVQLCVCVVTFSHAQLSVCVVTFSHVQLTVCVCCDVLSCTAVCLYYGFCDFNVYWACKVLFLFVCFCFVVVFFFSIYMYSKREYSADVETPIS